MKKFIKITENELKRMIGESLKRILGRNRHDSMMNEGFRKFSKPSNNQNTKRKGNLQIAYCKADKKRSAVTGQEKEFISVCLGHVWKDGAQRLVDAINSSVPKHIMNAALGNSNERVIIRVNIDMKNEIPNVVSKLNASIKQLGEYSDASIDTVCSEIFDEVDSVATDTDIENAKNKSISNWKEMLEKLEDPEVRKRLLKYQTTNDYARAYGHILSPNNVQDVLDQCPSASFVAEKSTWMKIFGRTIQPNAQRIVVTKPIQGQPSMSDLDAAAKIAGFASFKDAKIQTKNATQVMSEISNIAKRKTTNFVKVIMYDVSDTIPPQDPSKDVWTNTIGLSDNITGILNTHAQSFDDQITGGNAKAAQDSNKLAIDKAKEAKWQNRRYALVNLCQRKGIMLDSIKGLNDQEFIANATYIYAQSLIPSYGVIRPEDVNKISAMCAAAMCYSCDCKVPSSISKYIIGLKNLSINDVQIAFTIVHDILPSLSKSTRAKNVKAVTNESINKIRKMLNEKDDSEIISAKEFFKMCQDEFGNDNNSEEDIYEARQKVKNIISRLVKEEIKRRI